jgi:hypothetical protein
VAFLAPLKNLSRQFDMMEYTVLVRYGQEGAEGSILILSLRETFFIFSG